MSAIPQIPFRKLAAICIFTTASTAHAFGEPDPASPPVTIPSVSCSGGTGAAADGSIFAYATTSGSGRIYKLRADGTLDTSWGDSGWVAVDNFNASQVNLAVRPDGSIVMIRFSDSGIHFTPTGIAGVSYATNGFSAVGFAPDGSLIGYTLLPFIGQQYSNWGFTRFGLDGQIDRNWEYQGVITVPNIYGSIYAWSVLADGTLEVATEMNDASGTPVPRLRRYTLTTSADVATGRLLPQAGIASWTAPNVGVDPQGRVYFAVGDFSNSLYEAYKADVRLVRFGTDGQLDVSFGDGNNALFPFSGQTGQSGVTSVKALWQSASGEWNLVVNAARHPAGAPILLENSTRLVRYDAQGRPAAGFEQLQTFDTMGMSQVVRLVDGRLVHATNVSGCTIEHALGDTPAAGTMVEYYKASVDHYFMTLEGGESVLLDETSAGAGWARTGRTFGTWMPSSQLEGTTRLCRFYGDLKSGPDSHFYTPEGSECDGLRALDTSTPRGQYAWRFEGYAGRVVGAANGICPTNLTAVYRLYNRGFEKGGVPNHRYTADASLYQQMQSQGWAGEGVAFCMPPVPNNVSY